MPAFSKHTLPFRFSDQIDWQKHFELTFILVFCFLVCKIVKKM
jgi:hypothetical protein